MSKWIRNLRQSLTHRPVTIVHGNVRDLYVDEDGRLYENLTALLRYLAAQTGITFDEFISYDVVSGEHRTSLGTPEARPAQTEEANDALAQTQPDSDSAGAQAAPDRVLASWNQLLAAPGAARFVVLQYLDKCVSYKKSYAEEEREALLWLEKTIENIAGNNRLVLVALQDSMVPVELYTSAPKAALFGIPKPQMSDRAAFLRHRLSPKQADDETIETVVGLTDGSFLREMAPLISQLSQDDTPRSRQEIQRLVNKYRVGEQEDYWGQLSIDRIRNAHKYFVEEEGVKGQDEAVAKVIDTLTLARAGLSGVASGTSAKPRGVLFFAGPTGVGKTFLAKKSAKFLFATEDAFLRFDMSEFKEGHTVSKLIGSPPGYVGFEEGGALTNGVRDKPFCVVLFDEIEKAHPKILDIYLQILDDGRLTDSRGQTVYFTETIIIFTSNIGTRSTDSDGRPLEEGPALLALMNSPALTPAERQERVRAHFAEAVQRFFISELSRPELLNRIGNRIVPFNPIDSQDVQGAIVTSHLNRIANEIADKYRKRGLRVAFDDSVSAWLVEQHGRRIAQFGGRGITNAVEDEILTPLARNLLQAEDASRENVTFDCRFAAESRRLRFAERGQSMMIDTDGLVTLRVSLDGHGDQVALVLDASESASDHRDTIVSLAIQTILSLPARIDCSVFFLGNPASYPARQLESNVREWFDENQRRASLVGPVIRALAALGSQPALAVIGSGIIFDLEDWIDQSSFSNLILMPVDEPLCANDLSNVSIAQSTEQLVQRLHDPIVAVDISASAMLPVAWANPAYRLQLKDGQFHVVATTAAQFDVCLTCQASFGVPEHCWAQRQSGSRVPVAICAADEHANGAETILLTQAEADVFGHAVRRQPFTCPQCAQSHAWNTIYCDNASAPQYRFTGSPLYPSLEERRARGFVVCRQSSDKVYCEVSERAVLRLGENRALAMLEGSAYVLEYERATSTWKQSQKLFDPYVALTGDRYVLNYR